MAARRLAKNLVVCFVRFSSALALKSPASSALPLVSGDLPPPSLAANSASIRPHLAIATAVLVVAPSVPLIGRLKLAHDQGWAESSPREAASLGEVYSSFVVDCLARVEESRRSASVRTW